MDTIRFVLAVLIWATFPPAIVFWYLVHPFVGYWRRVGGPLQTYLVVGPVCVLLLGVLLRWNPVAGTDLGTNWILFAVGFGLWVVSWAMERAIRKHLDFRTLAGVPELAYSATQVPRIPTMEEFIGEDGEDSENGSQGSMTEMVEESPSEDDRAGPDPRGRLLDEGIYARVRHPRYAAVMIGVWGWAMMSNHGTSYLMAAALVPALLGVIHFEEKELVERFGDDYRAYRERVPALFPRSG